MLNHQLTTESSSDKAWHILALLLSMGRPAPLAEISSRCTLFHATPDLIHSLCQIPYSPISLTKDFSVTLSVSAFISFTEFVAKNIVLLDSLKTRIQYGSCSDDFLSVLLRKRKRSPFDDSDDREVTLPKRIRKASAKAFHQITDGVSRSIPSVMSVMLNLMLEPPLFLKFGSEESSFKLKEAGNVEGEADLNTFALRMVPKRLMISGSNLELDLPSRLFHDRHLNRSISVNAPCCPEDAKQNSILSADSGVINDAGRATSIAAIECERISEGKEEEQLIELDSLTRKETLSPVLDTALIDILLDKDSNRSNSLISGGNELTLDRDPSTIHVNDRAISSATELPVASKLLGKPSSKKDFFHRDGIDSKQQALSKSLARHKAFNTPKDQQYCKRDLVSVVVGLKATRNQNDMRIKDQKGNFTSLSPKDQTKPKVLPNFESYIVEEEEGSGGYGTVYRARRKSDGTIVAIKCPHANANKHHVNNELRMLERFGGKNFIIKYQGCFKSGDSDCFVLEHVKHDRPEVLKKEIDISEIQWYGYCMFRALASLHKQGIVHRDVKPGNFLFCRKATKGYLIDFNLAMDLHHKYGIINKSKVGYDVGLNHLPSAKYIPPTNNRKVPSAKPLAAVKQGATKGSNSTLENKNLKRKVAGQTKAGNDLSSWSLINSQGADGSGLTSAKDVTSAKTPSAERLREPLPCHGRKELISLLQQAMQSPNHQTLQFPAPMRKRVAAPPGKMDREVYLTPMPLHSSGIAVAGAGLRNKGNAKNNKEGPCAGTKGFRAPEVLFRSQHQGPKVDIWSAGVTLLYLMTGRAPFFGDPEQNIKDIVRLKGSEELWEVAKMHNRESSFPEDLYDTRSLAPMNLRGWCKMNTKRPDFLEVIPSSLFDLVDKCLTVNPRLRLSAEDALKHEFFAPCHERLKKHKLLRQGLTLDNTTTHQSQKQSIAEPVKSSR